MEQEISEQTVRAYQREATALIDSQREVQADDTESFTAFLDDYFKRQNA
jgi:site-specific recombinase XerC